MKENKPVQNSPMHLDIELSQKRLSDQIDANEGCLLHLPKYAVSLDGARLSYGEDGLDILMGALQ